MKKVLIIDDDNLIIETIRMTLDIMTNWEILTAGSGYKGIELALEHQPDLILLDVMMPSLSGEETMKKLKENPLTKDIDILFLTANNNLPRQWQEFGVKGRLQKPFDPLVLHELIAEKLNWELNN